MRILVLGNSVALRIRPPRGGAEEMTYAEWLRRAGHDVRVVARAGVLLSEAFGTLEDDVVSGFPDCVVINHGVVEACPRRTIRWINNRTIRNYYLNAILARPFVHKSAIAAATLLGWRFLNGGIRRLAALAGLRWHWTAPGRFLEVLEQTIGVVLKETAARVVVLGISPTSSRIEQQLQGSGTAIGRANAAMERLCGRLGARVSFLDPHVYLTGHPVEAMVPDGIHFSAEAHRRTATALCALLESGAPPAADAVG